MANTNGNAAFSLDELMENIKNTQAKPARQKKKPPVPAVQDSTVPSLLDETSVVENKSMQHTPQQEAASKPTAGYSIGELTSRAVRAKQEMEEKLGKDGLESRSEFSEVFGDQERKAAVLGANAPLALAKEKVAAYIRVSTDSSDQENSYETQERYFTRLLATNPSWVPVGIYSDYGISGTSKDKRTGFNRLLRHCADGRIDRIVCKSISRFTRNTADFLTALRLLKDNDVTIYFEKEGLDTANPMNDFVVTTLAAIAQQESYSISENIRLGIEKRHQNGEVKNAEIYGYRFNGNWITTESGFKYQDVDIIEEEAVVVRRVFEEAADGNSYKEIARGLNADHIPVPKCNRGGKKKGALKDGIDEGWTAQTVSGSARPRR